MAAGGVMSWQKLGGFKMKVGDLVQYKAFPNEGCGVVMKNNAGYVLIWFSYPDQDSDYMWEPESELEVICK